MSQQKCFTSRHVCTDMSAGEKVILLAIKFLTNSPMMKRQFDIAFKKEVLDYMENENKSAYKAAHHFSAKHKYCFSEKLFQNWNKNKDRIRETHSAKKRAIGGGRKPTLEELEHLLSDEIIELRISKYKVTRAFIADRARMLAAENGKEGFKASFPFSAEGFKASNR